MRRKATCHLVAPHRLAQVSIIGFVTNAQPNPGEQKGEGNVVGYVVAHNGVS